ncbi:hypothetical protein AVEN_207909-1 [Araneus ventricosus]|uniref:Uncharacterized protein n=1 Tax=Araneus ventricosus TaxID=182803 RepID=A0A4Y2U393_ARAVE|nr:hypothetical protein AVEN_207909-1 [Araneus ventricosus]
MDLVILNSGQITRMTSELLPRLSKLPHHTNGRTFGHYVRFNVQHAPCTEDLQWNRVSNLEPSAHYQTKWIKKLSETSFYSVQKQKYRRRLTNNGESTGLKKTVEEMKLNR